MPTYTSIHLLFSQDPKSHLCPRELENMQGGKKRGGSRVVKIEETQMHPKAEVLHQVVLHRDLPHVERDAGNGNKETHKHNE